MNQEKSELHHVDAKNSSSAQFKQGLLGTKPTTNTVELQLLKLESAKISKIAIQLIRARSLYETYHYWTSNETFTSVTSGSKFHGVVLFAVKYIPTSKVNR